MASERAANRRNARKHHVDESAIDADAFRRNADILIRIDHLIASTEARRDRALAGIAFCPASWALRSRGRIVDDETRPRTEAKMSPKMLRARG
jgi:hypothetical protein